LLSELSRSSTHICTPAHLHTRCEQEDAAVKRGEFFVMSLSFVPPGMKFHRLAGYLGSRASSPPRSLFHFVNAWDARHFPSISNRRKTGPLPRFQPQLDYLGNLTHMMSPCRMETKKDWLSHNTLPNWGHHPCMSIDARSSPSYHPNQNAGKQCVGVGVVV